jgi:hypothetical protein
MNVYCFKRLMFTCVFFTFATFGNAQEEARVWTNKEGQTVTAKIVGVNEGGKVVILFKGKEVALALDTLSEADNEYVAQWKTKREELEKKRAGQATMFAGKQLKMGGQINNFAFDYSPEALATVKNKFKSEDTGYRIAITVPEGFDSRKPQKVFILANARNSKAQSRMGNVKAIHNFNKTTAAEGWVCIAYDSSLGNDVPHIIAWNEAMKKFSEEWPDFNSWIFACGGNSGGAKGAMLHTAYHLACERKVRGLFLSSCNQATNLPIAREHHKVRKSALRDTRCFISSNSKTTKVTPADLDRVEDTIKSAGLRTIKAEWHQGAPGIFQDHFAEALRWFAQEKP